MPLRKGVVGEFNARAKPRLQQCGVSKEALKFLLWTHGFMFEVSVTPP